MTEIQLFEFISRLVSNGNGDLTMIVVIVIVVAVGWYVNKIMKEHFSSRVSNDPSIADRFNSVDHAILGINGSIGKLEARLDRFDERFIALETSIVKLDSGHDQMDSKFNGLEDRFRQFETSFAQVTTSISVLSGEVAEIHRMLNTIITSQVVASKPLSQSVVRERVVEEVNKDE